MAFFTMPGSATARSLVRVDERQNGTVTATIEPEKTSVTPTIAIVDSRHDVTATA